MTFLRHPKVLAIVLVLAASCSESDSRPASKGVSVGENAIAQELFAKIHVGMTRADLEELLGKPVLPEIAPN